MSDRASFKVFSLAFGVTYMALFFYSEVTRAAMFRYYPVLGQWTREVLPLQTAGPPILWYSWLFGAAVVSAVLAAIVPRKIAERIPLSWTWSIGFVLVLVIIVYERRWFY